MNPNVPPRTILVAIDYSEHSRRALAQALELARAFASKVVLVFAWEAPYAQFPLTGDHPEVDGPSLFDRVRQQCEDTMVELIRQVETEAAGVDVSWFVLSGEPDRVVLQQAEGSQADLIVLGSHGRKTAARWFLGSVAESVMRHAPCPVMVVKAAAAA